MDIWNKLKWIIGSAMGADLAPVAIELPANSNTNLAYLLQKSAIAMGANYSFELIYIVHWVTQFFMHNKSILGGLQCQ